MKFEKWMKEVKRIFEEKTGMSGDNLPEEDYKELFYPDYSPEDAVNEELSCWGE